MTRISKMILVLGAMLIALPLQAQHRIGVVAGIATGKTLEENEGTNTTDDDDPLMSIVLGLSMRHQLQGSLVFQPEAIFVQKGFADENSDGKVSMSYIELPLLFQYGFETSGMIKPFLTAGPEVGFQISCNVFDTDGDKQSCEDTYGEESTFKKFDAGLVIGGGLKRDRLSLNVRYDLGLLNIEKAEGWVGKNRALMILLGFDL